MNKYIVIDPLGFPGKSENVGMCTTDESGDNVIEVGKQYCKKHGVNDDVHVLSKHGNITMVGTHRDAPVSARVCIYVVKQGV